MGNFDFKAFVAQQKEDARQEKEQRIIKESKEHRTLKGLLEGHAAQDILLGFSANNSKIKISEREFDLVCNRLFDDLRESEEQESKSLIKESNKNYYEQLVKEYISQKKNIPIQEIQLNEGLWDFVKKITKKVGNAIEAEKTDLFGGIPREEQEKFEKIINQASSQEIKGIASVIKNEAPDFPNNVCDPNDEACTDGGELQFKSILAAFEVVYDSLNERSQKWCQDPDIQDGLDPKSAEALISKLRYLLRFYLDRKLKDKYRYVKEEQEEQEADLVEEQEFFKELRESINTLYNQDMILEAAMMPGNLGIKGDRGRQPNQIGGGADEEYKKAEEILGSPELAKAWYQIDIAFREAGKSAGFSPQNLKVAIQAYAKQGKDAEYVVDLLLQNAASAKEKNQVSDGDTPMDQLQTWKKYRKWKVTDKPGQITGEYDADGGSKVVMKSLRSHKLPMFLLGLASMMGAFGWLAKTPLFKDWIKDYFSTIIQTGKEAIPGKDVIKTFSESVPMKTISELGATSGGTGYWQALGLGDFSDGAPALETLKRAAMEVGDNVQDGLSNMSTVFANPEARQALLDRVAYFEQTNPGVSFGEFFPDGSENTGLWLVHPGSAMVKTITTKMVVGTAKGVAATAIKATLGGSILMALGAAAPMVGVGALVSALGVGLLRLKGRRDSRAQLMNDLLKKMKTPEDCIEDPPTEEDPKTGNPPTDDPLSDIGVGDFVIVKNKKGQEILTKVSEMPQNLQEKNQWEEEGNVFITGGDWSIPLGGRRGYSSKGQKWIAVKDGEVQIRKAEAEDFTRAVETDSKVADKMDVPKMDHEAEFEDDERQNVEYSKFQERLANDQRIWGDDSEPTISPGEMTTIFKAIKVYAGDRGHFQRFIMHGTDQGAGAEVDGDFLPDASRTADSLDEAKVQDLELKGVVNLLAKSIVPKLETNVPKKIVMGAILDSLIKAKLLITHNGKRLKKSPKFKSKMKPTKYNSEMDVPKGEMGRGPAPKAVSKELREILKRINRRLRVANKKQITAPQLLEYLKSRKKKLLK